VALAAAAAAKLTIPKPFSAAARCTDVRDSLHGEQQDHEFTRSVRSAFA
jgi:hypothetical protein